MKFRKISGFAPNFNTFNGETPEKTSRIENIKLNTLLKKNY
jgi:hypothetical protein